MECTLKKILILICTLGLLAIGVSGNESNTTIPENNFPTQIESNYQEETKENNEDSQKDETQKSEDDSINSADKDSNTEDKENAVSSENNAVQEVDYSLIRAEALKNIPAYSSKPYAVVNNNVPFFNESDLVTYSYEKYSDLDSLGRCGVVIANVGKDIMPTEERGNIGMIKPSGWHTVKYQGIDGNYLYKRCHLLGYQLTAENANVKNLITGTRYMNVQGMLPFENQVAEYVKSTNNHVLLRVTPIFEGNNLLASGVLMEAKSVEDNGKGVLFNVCCYNVQPGITINYATGESEGPEFTGSTTTTNSSTNTNTNTNTESTTPVTPSEPENTSDKKEVTYILNKNSSSMKIHYPDCGSVKKMSEKNKVYFTGTLAEAKAMGYSPCGNCKP